MKSSGRLIPVFLIFGASTLMAQIPTREAAQEQLAAAEARYRSALVLAPEMPAYHFSLALVLDRQGRSAEALTEYAAAARLDSTSARNRAGYGDALLRAGRPAEAVTQLEVATTLDRGNAEYRELLAKAHEQLGQWNQAATVLREASQIAPRDARLNRELQSAAAKTGAAANVSQYHDYSDFADDYPQPRLPIFEIVFGVIFGLAALALFAPVAGTLVVLARHALQSAMSGRASRSGRSPTIRHAA